MKKFTWWQASVIGSFLFAALLFLGKYYYFSQTYDWSYLSTKHIPMWLEYTGYYYGYVVFLLGALSVVFAVQSMKLYSLILYCLVAGIAILIVNITIFWIFPPRLSF